MKVELKNIPIKEIVGEYGDYFVENKNTGTVRAMKDQALEIRPEYQRAFIYKEKEQQAVINTIKEGFPLNSMYFVDREDGSYEVLDGQQRILSICMFINNEFAIKIPSKTKMGLFDTVNYGNLSKEMKNKILDYELTVYMCSGSEEEKLSWFQTINIAGQKLTDQEVLNAVYHGKWLSDLKLMISRKAGSISKTYGKYFKGKQDRQEWLETVLRWLADSEDIASIDLVMMKHYKDASDDGKAVWSYIEHVFEWVEKNFGKFEANQKGIEWGILYNHHKDDNLDPAYLQAEVKRLLKDYEVQSKKGIYEYLLTDEEKLLNLRTFDDRDKMTAYEKQDHKCAMCGKTFEYNEMHGDHIKAWSKGGKTEPDNLQMLCEKCNLKKSSKG